jgi:uncharacterized protein YbbC (DUF1343 family)/CubicO group peptidase (beta-lactamase class C family)
MTQPQTKWIRRQSAFAILLVFCHVSILLQSRWVAVAESSMPRPGLRGLSPSHTPSPGNRKLRPDGILAALEVNDASAADRWPGEVSPECIGMDWQRLAEIDGVVRDAIEQHKCPGAVVLVTRFGQVAWWRPYGTRAVEQPNESSAPPLSREPMSRETVFDMASLTKVMATATSVMILIDRGEVSLTDPVSRYIPEFSQNGKEAVTIEQLLRHRGGFIADNPLDDYRDGPQQAMERIWRLKPIYEPGSKFLYTDVGYIVLGELVRRVSGQSVDQFSHDNIFSPLGMDETTFHPDAFLRSRTAPTEVREGRWMRAEVHDPRSYLLGGVAGHAGLFSTARDVSVFAQMMLGKGERRGRRILSPGAVTAMISPGTTPHGQARGLGWDIDTGFSSIRGELFPVGGFGHTGFTGTSLWIDPSSETAVIILTNRVHPDGKGDVRELRRRVATIVASSIRDRSLTYSLPPSRIAAREPCLTNLECGDSSPLFERLSIKSGDKSPHSKFVRQRGARVEGPAADMDARMPLDVLCGIDVLLRDNFKQLRGRKIGLITNHTGVDRDGHPTIDLVHAGGAVHLVALFSPEHGIRGLVDSAVADSVDEKTRLPIYSLYDKNRRKPTAEQLRGIDTLVFDIQDIGCRFYTYSATLGLAMEAAAEHKLKFVVLDRPNPIGGELVEGPVLDAGRESFTGYHRIPVRHGLTLGELAQLYNGERHIGVDLEVIRCEGWQRDQHFDATGLTWINPSPNMRSLRQAELYPGIGLLETTNLSVGRGTDTPFEVIGAPWLDARRLATGLAAERLEGVVFVPVRFIPNASVHANKECAGVQIIVTDRARFRAVRTGLAIARQLRILHEMDWQIARFPVLLANERVFEAVKAGRSLDEIESEYREDLGQFERTRMKFLLY